jgi:hypothetical protein
LSENDYTVRIFFAIISFQIFLLYTDIYNAFPNIRPNGKYVIHFMSIYLTPLGIGFGIVLHMIEIVKGRK